jgi:MFS family permease
VLDGVLPLHFSSRLSQAQIGLAYAATGVLIAVAAMSASRLRPAPALALGGVGLVAGVAAAGLVVSPAVWLVALALIGLGMGATETGATGVLLEAVPTDRIVTAMVVWSQIGMLGYLLAPAVGAPLAQAYGFRTVGLVPLVAGAVVMVAGLAAWPDHRRASR